MYHPPMPVRYQVSSLISQEPEHRDYKMRLVKALIDNGSAVLKKLMVLQDKGWNDEGTDHHFQKQRDIADNASPELENYWFTKMKDLLGEIDSHLNCIPEQGAIRFLDLGCCPGGFSSYILGKNIDATGTGVSLPDDDGGHTFKLEESFRSRYKLFLANLTKYQLQSFTIDDQRLQPLPSEISEASFDIVLLDGHQLRTQISAQPGDINRLLISQLIIGLRSVKKGGIIIMKLPLPHKPVAARILYMFKMISSRILRWKPAVLHANRGTFYVVADGVGGGFSGLTVSNFIRELQDLWFNLTYGGEGGSGRHMTPEDLDFIAPVDDLINHHLDWLSTFGNPLWHVQANALERLYKKKHVSQYNVNS